MKQLTLFSQVPTSTICWHLYVDGAARNNPGPAGAGVYLLKDGEPYLKQGLFLGSITNNQAEYLALLFGLLYAHTLMNPKDKLCIHADSQLLVRQITGHYALKNAVLKKLWQEAQSLLRELHYTITYIPRAQNSIADALANTGIDKKISIPAQFQPQWQRYEQILKT